MDAPTRLRIWRTALRKTQDEAAEMLGTDQATISKIEKGTARPTLALACAIERATTGHELGVIVPREWDAEREAKPAT